MRKEDKKTIIEELQKKLSASKVVIVTDYKGLNSMQVFLGIHTDAINWQLEPIIYVSGVPIREKLNIDGKYASLQDFFD